MSKFDKNLKVVFFEGNRIVMFADDIPYTKLEGDSSLYLDLTDTKDINCLNILLSCKSLLLQRVSYLIVSREFDLDGTALYIVLERV